MSSRLMGSAGTKEGEGAARTGEGVTNPPKVEGFPLLDGFGIAWRVQGKNIHLYNVYMTHAWLKEQI